MDSEEMFRGSEMIEVHRLAVIGEERRDGVARVGFHISGCHGRIHS